MNVLIKLSNGKRVEKLKVRQKKKRKGKARRRVGGREKKEKKKINLSERN